MPCGWGAKAGYSGLVTRSLNGHAMALSRKVAPPDLAVSPETLRRDRLRLALPATVAQLKLRQAGQIDAEDIEAYVALEWLEWQGGGLRLTITGANVCAQVAPAVAI